MEKKTVRLKQHNTLHDMLVEMQHHLQTNSDTIGTFESHAGEIFGVTGFNDGEGDYYVVGYPSLPTDVYAEIEDGTYGELQGWRIYV